MKHTAAFIRKPTREELQPQAVVIEKVLTLSDDAWREFKDAPLEDRGYIADHRELMHEDSLGVHHCILLRNDNQTYGYLVNSEGYDYARYVSIYTGPEVNPQ